ncbi:MAG: hypothetical protein KKG59_02990 [Nanoarchaeota archaeon]|nr:hypothetical protein [Nanoarchaeota archaeon]
MNLIEKINRINAPIRRGIATLLAAGTFLFPSVNAQDNYIDPQAQEEKAPDLWRLEGGSMVQFFREAGSAFTYLHDKGIDEQVDIDNVRYKPSCNVALFMQGEKLIEKHTILESEADKFESWFERYRMDQELLKICDPVTGTCMMVSKGDLDCNQLRNVPATNLSVQTDYSSLETYLGFILNGNGHTQDIEDCIDGTLTLERIVKPLRFTVTPVPNSGPAPLKVALEWEATGGVPPYVFGAINPAGEQSRSIDPTALISIPDDPGTYKFDAFCRDSKNNIEYNVFEVKVLKPNEPDNGVQTRKGIRLGKGVVLSGGVSLGFFNKEFKGLTEQINSSISEIEDAYSIDHPWIAEGNGNVSVNMEDIFNEIPWLRVDYNVNHGFSVFGKGYLLPLTYSFHENITVRDRLNDPVAEWDHSYESEIYIGLVGGSIRIADITKGRSNLYGSIAFLMSYNQYEYSRSVPDSLSPNLTFEPIHIKEAKFEPGIAISFKAQGQLQAFNLPFDVVAELGYWMKFSQEQISKNERQDGFRLEFGIGTK